MSHYGRRGQALLSTGFLHLILVLHSTPSHAQEEILQAHQDMRSALVRIEGEGETPNGEPISVFGTGVLLDAHGTILTALHVLAPLEASDPTKIAIRVRIREAEALPRAAEPITNIEARDLAVLRIYDPPENLSHACRTTSGDPPNDLPILLTSGFEGDGSYVRRQGPTIGSGPRGAIFVDMAAVEAQSSSPVYRTSGEVVGILKGVREGRTGESVVIPLSDVLGQLPAVPRGCQASAPPHNSNAEPSQDRAAQWPMAVLASYDEFRVTHSVGGRDIVTLDVGDYQDRVPITADDVVRGESSIAIRLGREDDMFLISEFWMADSQVCSKHLFVQLRDGGNIQLSSLGLRGNGEYYGVRFGLFGDLYNEYGFDRGSLTFVFDPSVPRTGLVRIPVAAIQPGQYTSHHVQDTGCL